MNDNELYARLAAERRGVPNRPNPVVLAHFRRRIEAGERPEDFAHEYGIRHEREVAKYVAALR